MDNLNQHIVHAGWLIKSPPEKRIWKTKWRRRWFILKLSGQIPGQYVLEYFTDSTCKKLKGQIDLDQCEQVDAGLQLEIRKQNYDNMFDLRTSKRTYYLVAGSEEEMNKWVECICAVCGLKMETIQNELSLLPSLDNEERYSPQPSQPDQQQQNQNQHQNQQQQSTSESSLSTLNYIPISECYTGKPSHSPPPPRPPKPASFSKSQSSLALWPQDQVQGQSTQSQQQSRLSPTKISAPGHILPQMSTSNVLNMPVNTTNNNNNNLLQKPLISMVSMVQNSNQNNPNFNNRLFYLNSMNNNMTSYNQPYNIYDTWHSKSKKSDFLAPPLVNRDLKPNRRRILEQQQNNHQQTQHQNQHLQLKSDSNLNPNMKQSFKNINSSSTNSRHTLPRPIDRYKNNENYCEQSKTMEDSERQYLDLDLDCETNHNSNSNSNSPSLSNNNELNVPNTNNTTNNNNNNGTMQIDSMPVVSSNHSNWNIPTINNLLGTITTAAKLPQTILQQPDILLNNSSNTNNNLINILNDNKTPMGVSTSNNNVTSIPMSDNSGTVYKKVDFLKTKAFNEMRLNVNMYRNAN